MKGSIRAIGIWTVAACGLCSWGAVSGEAAAIDPAVLSSLRPGQRVCVATADGELAGRFVAVRDGDLLLDDPPARIAIDSLRDAHVRSRGTTEGALIGGGTAAIGTALLFVLAAGAMCEADCGGGDALLFGALGAVGGGLAGSVAGGLIGAAVPDWQRLDRPRRAPTGAIGSASFGLGYGNAFDTRAAGGGFGGRLALAAEMGVISPGLEIGRHGLGRGRVVNARGETLDYSESLVFFGPTLTLGPPRGRMRPYVLASVGRYFWNTLDPQVQDGWSGVLDPQIQRDFTGGSLGAGVRWRAAEPLSVGMEGRWHTNLERVPRVSFAEKGHRMNVVSFNAGATLSW